MSAILNTYNRKKVAFNKGKGSFLYGTNGKKYLDFVQGIAVNCLGHASNYLINSISKQSKKLWHVSNAFIIPEQERLAKRLKQKTFHFFQYRIELHLKLIKSSSYYKAFLNPLNNSLELLLYHLLP